MGGRQGPGRRRRKEEGRGKGARMREAERRTGPEIVRSTEGGREVGHLNKGLWEAWMEKEVTEDKTRKEDTDRRQRGREQFEEGEQLSWSKSSGLRLLRCRQTGWITR